jgi:hypothetical protein
MRLKMKYCRFCGNALPIRESVKFCPKCGKNISAQKTTQSRPPREAIGRSIQPKPIRKQGKHKPKIQTREDRSKSIQIEKSKIEITPEQQLVLYNQRIKASIERSVDSNSNLEHRDSYQLSDHSHLVIQLNELLEFRNNKLFPRSEYVDTVNETLSSSKNVLLRVSEFLTSHLDIYELQKVRNKWFNLKEQQSHLILDRDRIKSIIQEGAELEKNFNLIGYQLENTQNIEIPRSVFFASFPEIHHNYFELLGKTISGYVEKIEASGFNSYFRDEVRYLERYQKYFTDREYQMVNPLEVHQGCIGYLEAKNKASNKINSRLIEIQRKIITNKDVIDQLKDKYLAEMENAIDNTPHDILLMSDHEVLTKPIISLDKKRKKKGVSWILQSNSVDQMTNLEHLNDLNDLEKLKSLSKLETLKDSEKLS